MIYYVVVIEERTNITLELRYISYEKKVRMNVAYNSINCVIKKISNRIEILKIFNVIIIK